MTSLTSKRAREDASKQREADRLTDEEVIRSVMKTPRGRRWIWRRLEETRVFIGDENIDPQYMAFEKGRRNEGLKLLHQVLAFASNDYIVMTNENSLTLKRMRQPLQERTDSDGGPDSDSTD